MRPDSPLSSEAIGPLRQALAGRLREVHELRRAVASRAAARAAPGPISSGPAGWPEEILRRFMVSVLAAARDRPGPGPDRTLFFSLLAGLEPQARSEDLRFLDAWNSAFEVLVTWPREELAGDESLRALDAYASLLEAHLERLGDRP